MLAEQRTPYHHMLTARAHACVQDIKLQKAVTELDLTNHTKRFPPGELFDTQKSVNIFPAFRLRRERTINDLQVARSEVQHLNSALELIKDTDQKRKNLFTVSGSRIKKDADPDSSKRPQKMWSLDTSRTLPSITQCFTPLPRKMPIKRIAIKKELFERESKTASESKSRPIPPLSDSFHIVTAPRKQKKEEAKTEKPEERNAPPPPPPTSLQQNTELPRVVSSMVDKTTMTGDSVNSPRSTIESLKNDNSHMEPKTPFTDGGLSSRSLCSRGSQRSIRPWTQSSKLLPEMFKASLSVSLGGKTPQRTWTADAENLPRIGKRLPAYKPRNRTRPAPFRFPPHSVFLKHPSK